MYLRVKIKKIEGSLREIKDREFIFCVSIGQWRISETLKVFEGENTLSSPENEPHVCHT